MIEAGRGWYRDRRLRFRVRSRVEIVTKTVVVKLLQKLLQVAFRVRNRSESSFECLRMSHECIRASEPFSSFETLREDSQCCMCACVGDVSELCSGAAEGEVWVRD